VRIIEVPTQARPPHQAQRRQEEKSSQKNQKLLAKRLCTALWLKISNPPKLSGSKLSKPQGDGTTYIKALGVK
jgi:hypothetical protein